MQSFDQIFRNHKTGSRRRRGRRVSRSSSVKLCLQSMLQIFSMRVVYEDGKTAHEKPPRKNIQRRSAAKWMSGTAPSDWKAMGGIVALRWLPGTLLGKTWSSDEHLVAAETGEVCPSQICTKRCPKSRCGAQKACAELWVILGDTLTQSRTMQAPRVSRSLRVQPVESGDLSAPKRINNHHC